jgi:hypothetical protein
MAPSRVQGQLQEHKLLSPPMTPCVCPGRYRGSYGSTCVAAKCIFSQMLAGTLEEVEREARFLHKLRHPSIVTFFGVRAAPATVAMPPGTLKSP